MTQAQGMTLHAGANGSAASASDAFIYIDITQDQHSLWFLILKERTIYTSL